MGETARQPACGQRCVQLSPQRQPRERAAHPGHRPCGRAALAGAARGRIRWRAGTASGSARADTRAMQVSSLISVLRAPRRMRQTQRSFWPVNGIVPWGRGSGRRIACPTCYPLGADDWYPRSGLIPRVLLRTQPELASPDHRNPQDINDAHPRARLTGKFSARKTPG
jgi:hypothetical protein